MVAVLILPCVCFFVFERWFTHVALFWRLAKKGKEMVHTLIYV